MKIQDLVWDKYSGELIGFVDLGDINTNFATLKDVDELATHILVILAKSIVNPLTFSFASFATTGITAHQIMPIFWKGVCYLEQINLHVVAATADGASPNRRFFKLHKFLQGDSQENVVYRAKNIHLKDRRFIYFLQMYHTLLKLPVIVLVVLDLVVQHDICGIVSFFYGHIFHKFMMNN